MASELVKVIDVNLYRTTLSSKIKWLERVQDEFEAMVNEFEPILGNGKMKIKVRINRLVDDIDERGNQLRPEEFPELLITSNNIYNGREAFIQFGRLIQWLMNVGDIRPESSEKKKPDVINSYQPNVIDRLMQVNTGVMYTRNATNGGVREENVFNHRLQPSEEAGPAITKSKQSTRRTIGPTNQLEMRKGWNRNNQGNNQGNTQGINGYGDDNWMMAKQGLDGSASVAAAGNGN